MEIKRISSQVLSIFLCAEDMAELDITYEELDILCPHSRNVLRQLLECALAQTGFDPAKGERLLIEAYPLEGEACLLLFTLKNTGTAPPKERVDAEPSTLWYFSDFGALLEAVRCLEPTLSSALYWRDGRYCLSISGEAPSLPAAVTADDPELALAELQEQQLVLIPEKAVAKLQQHFIAE